MYTFTTHQQQLIQRMVFEEETLFGKEMTLRQLFENDRLYLLLNDENIPEYLKEINFSFLGRQF